MIKTDRLDKKEVLDLIDGNRFEKIFLDIDYTVLDFYAGHKKGVEKLNKFIPKLGDKMDKIFELILRGQRNLNDLTECEQKKYKEMMRKIGYYQPNVVFQYGLKHSSRETMTMVAAGDLGLNLEADEIRKIRQIYWQTIARYEDFFEDAIPFLEKIKKEKIKIIWVTGSDSVLKVRQVGDKIEFDYDPKYSAQEKKKRLKKLLEMYPGKLVVGDPVDKPEIWKKIFRNVDVKKTLCVGDSYWTDLKPAEDLGMETVLIGRG